MKIKYLKNKIEKTPYLKNFEILSSKVKRRRVKLMDLLMKWLSGNNIDSFLEFYLRRTAFGLKILKNQKHSDKFMRLIERLDFYI